MGVGRGEGVEKVRGTKSGVVQRRDIEDSRVRKASLESKRSGLRGLKHRGRGRGLEDKKNDFERGMWGVEVNEVGRTMRGEL